MVQVTSSRNNRANPPVALESNYLGTEALDRLSPKYKPTELQLSVPHLAVIDWVPYAALRDRVLLCYNDSAALDRLLYDMMNSYVIGILEYGTFSMLSA